MTEQRKADRYAQAILEAVLERWQNTLGQVSDALAQNEETRARLESTQLDVDAKMEDLQKFIPADASQEIQNFLKLLVQEGDLDLIPAIVGSLQAGVAGQAQPQKAEITSATELSEEEKQEIRRRLAEQYGEGLIFNFRVDPSLMGGLRVRVGDTLIDNSVASRLTALREVIASAVR